MTTTTGLYPHGKRQRVPVSLSAENAVYLAERMRLTGQRAGVVVDIIVTERRLQAASLHPTMIVIDDPVDGRHPGRGSDVSAAERT